MAYSQFPLANTPNVSYGGYDIAQYAEHDFAQGMVGLPHIAASGSSTGNGAYPVFTAPGSANVFTLSGTVVVPGTGAASGITLSLVRANNGSNVSNTVTTFNVVTTGTNASGNVFTFGPLTYNLYANGANSGFASVLPGGLSMSAGDTLVATHNGNTLCVSVFTEYKLQSSFNVSA